MKNMRNTFMLMVLFGVSSCAITLLKADESAEQSTEYRKDEDKNQGFSQRRDDCQAKEKGKDRHDGHGVDDQNEKLDKTDSSKSRKRKEAEGKKR